MSDLEQNLAVAGDYLQRFKAQPAGHCIAGAFEVPEDAEFFDNLSPADNRTLGRVVAGSEADMDRACQSAADAFDDHSQQVVSGVCVRKIVTRPMVE